MRGIKDIKNQRFGKLLVKKYAGLDKWKNALWHCVCDCGNELTTRGSNLRMGSVNTCGRCNIYCLEKEHIICKVANGKSFIFDLGDYEIVRQFAWFINSAGYVATKYNGRNQLLQRLLLSPSKNEVVDHINRNPLDNRRCNLRIATRQQNQFNLGVFQNNRTGHKNICAVGGKFAVYIKKDGKSMYFGRFTTLQKAVDTANEVRKRLFGEFAYIDPY